MLINLLILYKHFSLFWWDKAGILHNPGNKLIAKGKRNDNIKLIKVSFNKWSWVFLYTAPNIDK